MVDYPSKYPQADKFLILNPDKVSVWRVLWLLWIKRMDKNGDYITVGESADGNKEIEKILKDGLVIASLANQKLMRKFSKPLECIGRMLEKGLNLVPFNDNIFMLLFNVLRGKVIAPDRESDRFKSLCGHLDRRVKLDEKIDPGTPRYNSALAAMAAKLAYENKGFIKKTVEQHWKMELIGKDYNFWNESLEREGTQGFMFHDHDPRVNMIVVSFRGTEPFNAYDWCTDVDISCFEIRGMGKVHGGFMKALGLVGNGWPQDPPADKRKKKLAYYTIRDELKKRLELNGQTKFIVTGHSLGGALAILFPAIMALHEETMLLERLEGVYTFGQPRVGDDQFKKFMEEHVLAKYHVKYLRFVYCNDLVPRLPFHDPVFSLYTDFGTCLYFNSRYQGQIVEVEPNKNYVEMCGSPKRYLNAWFELLRSLYLPFKEGRDYREGLVMILVRFLGLTCPGAVDHNPLDYVNLTRLGSIQVFKQVESFKKIIIE